MDQSASAESPEVEKFMRLAVNEAKQALSRLEVPLGCVIVQDGELHYPFWESRTCITVVPMIDLGGCGSILALHVDGSGGCGESCSENDQKRMEKMSFECVGGILADEGVALLRGFYEQGNPNAPRPRRPVKIPV
ncbi:hypothetical protein R1flu_000374 [Riccia fluitans]|uniref:Uncharacterized protein n=1 Tax=Riccia fluitans TaxID=41844 RepID=A0ABD1Y178_9MARC